MSCSIQAQIFARLPGVYWVPRACLIHPIVYDAFMKSVSCREYQTILEKRYLCFQSWEKIAAAMDYDIRWLYRLHGKALEEVQELLDADETRQ